MGIKRRILGGSCVAILTLSQAAVATATVDDDVDTKLSQIAESDHSPQGSYSGYKDCNNGMDVGAYAYSSTNYILVEYRQNGALYTIHRDYDGVYHGHSNLNYSNVNIFSDGSLRGVELNCWA